MRTPVSLTLATHTLAVGVTPLLWGPLSDRRGRRVILLASPVLHAVTSAAEALAPDVWTFAAARGLQARGVSAAFVVGAGAIVDTHPPESRGRALGWMGVTPSSAPCSAPC